MPDAESVILLLLVSFLLLVGSVYGHQAFLGVPFVPTPKRAVRKMLELAKLQPGEVVLDLGAGDARFLTAAKRACPGITAVGYEVVPMVWVLGKIRIWLSGQQVTFLCQDMYKAPLEEADVVFLYLIPSVMKRVEAAFQSRLKPGTRIVSQTFQLPGHTPVAETYAGHLHLRLYVWGQSAVQ